MDLKRIIYSSQPFGYDDSTLAGILLDARHCNARDDITGALVCRRDIYLQFLEGPPAQIDATLQRIKRDDRHVSVTLRLSQNVSERMFGAWRMLHDPAQSCIWTEEEIDGGALDRASEADFRTMFARLSRQATATLGE
ncbi:MAG: BLUF domain-containing protein [Jannaschia sp.]